MSMLMQVLMLKAMMMMMMPLTDLLYIGKIRPAPGSRRLAPASRPRLPALAPRHSNAKQCHAKRSNAMPRKAMRNNAKLTAESDD